MMRSPDQAIHDMDMTDAHSADMDTMDIVDLDAGTLDVTQSPSQGCLHDHTLPTGHSVIKTIQRDGQERSWRVRLPANAPSRQPLPIVLALHGGLGNGERMELQMTNFNPIADREGIIMIYPDGYAKRPDARHDLFAARAWNAGTCCGAAQEDDVDDVAFLLEIIAQTELELCVDRSRIYATGMSNGAMMSYRLACEAADTFAAIAPVAGSRIIRECHPSRPVPLLHVHGMKDLNIPFDGGGGCGPGQTEESQPIEDVVTSFALAHACATTTSTTRQDDDVTCLTYDGCQDRVELCTLPQGDHSWPGGVPGSENQAPACQGDGLQVSGFDASTYIWQFFTRHHLPTTP